MRWIGCSAIPMSEWPWVSGRAKWACRRYAIGQVAPQIAECYRRVLAK